MTSELASCSQLCDEASGKKCGRPEMAKVENGNSSPMIERT